MKFNIEIVVKTKECDKIQCKEMELGGAVEELFEKLQKIYEAYGAEIKSITFIKEEQ